MRNQTRSDTSFSFGYLGAVTALAAAVLFHCGMASEFQRCQVLDIDELVAQHWVADTFITVTPGTILILHSRRYEPHMYEWGGPPSGLSFGSDGSFAEYENVLCSTESSPVRRWGETWRVMDDGSIEVCGPHRRIELEVLYQAECCLGLQVRAAEEVGCER